MSNANQDKVDTIVNVLRELLASELAEIERVRVSRRESASHARARATRVAGDKHLAFCVQDAYREMVYFNARANEYTRKTNIILRQLRSGTDS